MGLHHKQIGAVAEGRCASLRAQLETAEKFAGSRRRVVSKTR